MVAVLLDDAEAHGWTTPPAAQVADLVGSGLAARAETLLGPVSLRTRSRIALLATLSGAALTVPALITAELPTTLAQPLSLSSVSPTMVLYAIWPASAAAMLWGRARSAHRLALAALLLTIGLPLLYSPAVAGAWLVAPPSPVVFRPGLPPLYFLGILGTFAGLASLTTVHLSGSGRLTRCTAGFAALALVATTTLLGWLPSPDPWTRTHLRQAFYGTWGSGLSTIARGAPLLTTGALLVTLVIWRRRRGWIVPVTVVSVPWAYLTLIDGALGLPAWQAQALAVPAGLLTAASTCAALAYRAGFRLVRVPTNPETP
jgi:hypothetical protein